MCACESRDDSLLLGPSAGCGELLCTCCSGDEAALDAASLEARCITSGHDMRQAESVCVCVCSM